MGWQWLQQHQHTGSKYHLDMYLIGLPSGWAALLDKAIEGHIHPQVISFSADGGYTYVRTLTVSWCLQREEILQCNSFRANAFICINTTAFVSVTLMPMKSCDLFWFFFFLGCLSWLRFGTQRVLLDSSGIKDVLLYSVSQRVGIIWGKQTLEVNSAGRN